MAQILSYPNTVSIGYGLDLFDYMIKRSIIPVKFKFYTKNYKTEKFFTFTDYKTFQTDFTKIYQEQLLNNFEGTNIIRLEEVLFEVKNLSKWQCEFDLQEISKGVVIKERKLVKEKQQTIIDREIERYKQIVLSKLIEYNSNIDSITIPPLTNNSYVDEFYMNDNYVYPQIN